MPESESVSFWIHQLKNGNAQAGHKIWSRYLKRLVRVANSSLAKTPRRMADEEDVVIRAFTAFLDGVDSGRFERLSDRDDLWQILVMLTERHAISQMRAERAQKRGAGRVSAFSSVVPSASGSSYLEASDPTPTPEFALQASEELGQLLSRLRNTALQSVAIWRMEGFTNREIADRLGKSVCTVERKLKLIRELWVGEEPLG